MEAIPNGIAELSKMYVEQTQSVRRAERERDDAQHSATMQQIFADAARKNSERSVIQRVNAEQKLAAAQEENYRLRAEIRKLQTEMKRESRLSRIVRKAYEEWLDMSESFRAYSLVCMGIGIALVICFTAVCIASAATQVVIP